MPWCTHFDCIDSSSTAGSAGVHPPRLACQLPTNVMACGFRVHLLGPAFKHTPSLGIQLSPAWRFSPLYLQHNKVQHDKHTQMKYIKNSLYAPFACLRPCQDTYSLLYYMVSWSSVCFSNLSASLKPSHWTFSGTTCKVSGHALSNNYWLSKNYPPVYSLRSLL